MIVNVVSIWVKPELTEAFLQATQLNHNGSRREPGNRRFDVLQSHDDSSRFTLYEVFENEQAVETHRNTPHYLAWKETVASMMLKPREGKMHKPIFPSPTAAW